MENLSEIQQFSIFLTIHLDMMSAMKPLLDLSRTVLWHWKTFPIILPPPITVQSDQTQGEQTTIYVIHLVSSIPSLYEKLD